MAFVQECLRLYSLLPRAERRALFGVVLISLPAAMFETAGVASVLPFMVIIIDPSAIERYPWLSAALERWSVDSRESAVVASGAVTIVVLALANGASALNLWVQSRFIARVRRTISAELFAGYMRQPYQFHVKRDAASLTKVIFSDAELTIGSFLSPLLLAISKGTVAIVLLGFLLAYNPAVGVGAAVFLGGSYLVTYQIVQRKQGQLGAQLMKAAAYRSRSAIEGFGGIKELRVLGREAQSIARFNDATQRLTRAQVSNTLTAALPRFLLEVVAFSSIVAIAIVFVLRGDGQAALPTLALYAFAGYRLMPAFQQLFSSAVNMRFSKASVAMLESDLAEVVDQDPDPDAVAVQNGGTEALVHSIRFDHVSFSYPDANRPALHDLSFSIRRNESLGLIGRTGAGKTTLADLILGLYAPTSGSIEIDGRPLKDEAERRAWRRHVGYVPQSVFLSNATVTENIAIGLAKDDIDLAAVKRAAEIAQAASFISSLPDGYQSVVGERGVKLSGGQRQRIGIARALYHSPDMLILDEATSALDGLTEEAFMNSVQAVSADRTVVIIAHRLRTIERCGRILMVDEGRIVADGTYDELRARSLPFRQLTGQVTKEHTTVAT